MWLLLSHSRGNGLLAVTSSAANDALAPFTGENLTESVVTMTCLPCLNDYGFMIWCVLILWLEKELMSLVVSKLVRTECMWMLYISWWVTGRCWGEVKGFLQREIKPSSNSCALSSPASDTGCQLGLFHLKQRRRCETGSHVGQPAWSPVSPGKEEHKNIRHTLMSWATGPAEVVFWPLSVCLRDLLQNLTYSLTYVENEMRRRHQDLETLKHMTK